MMKKLPLVLALLMSAPGAFAAECGFGFDLKQGTCVPNIWLNSANIVIAISFALVAIVYMVGAVLENPKVINWSKAELYELLGTAVILVFYLALLAILNEIIGPAFYSSSIAYPGEMRRHLAPYSGWASVKQHVLDYIGIVSSSLMDALNALTKLSLFVGGISTFSLLIDLKITALYFTPFGIFGSIQQTLAIAAAAIGTSFLQLQIQREIVGLGDSLFSILLPLGIVLRAFPVTRLTGSALIAIVVGFTILLPIFYLFAEDISLHYYDAHCSGVRPSASVGIESIAGSRIESIDVENIQKLIAEKFVPGSYFSCVIFLAVVEAMFLPVAAYLIMLNITRRIAEILGAHIDLSTLVRFI